jgi:EAL domain-containing protein (putative c-di-GMP-specific phosphodiesterase class I)
MVGDVLAGTGLAPEHLTLEITETALMTNTEAAVTVLNALKKLGVMLAIDDFGTGFSSLAYLRELPLDVLKVDKSFVDGLGMSKDDEAIVGAVINLAHTLDLRVIAEGVETEDQLEVLRDLGCDYAQGFLFSRPVPEADLAQALAFSS